MVAAAVRRGAPRAPPLLIVASDSDEDERVRRRAPLTGAVRSPGALDAQRVTLERERRSLLGERKRLEAKIEAGAADLAATKKQHKNLALHVRAEAEATSLQRPVHARKMAGFASDKACVLESEVEVLRRSMGPLERAACEAEARGAASAARLERARKKLAAVPEAYSVGDDELASLRARADLERLKLERATYARSAAFTRDVTALEHRRHDLKRLLEDVAIETTVLDGDVAAWRGKLLAQRARVGPLLRRAENLRADFFHRLEGGGPANADHAARALYGEPTDRVIDGRHARRLLRLALAHDRPLGPLPDDDDDDGYFQAASRGNEEDPDRGIVDVVHDGDRLDLSKFADAFETAARAALERRSHPTPPVRAAEAPAPAPWDDYHHHAYAPSSLSPT